MAPPIIVGEKAQPASGGPAKQAAAQRVQRFWNPRTAHMEAMGAHGHLVGNEHLHPSPPPGHQVTHTQAKVTREVTPGAKPAVSFINMSPSEIEARARAITQAEIKGARGPFKEQLGLLGQEQTGALQTNTQAYGKLNETIGQQQTAQAAGAKTFENYAADAVTKAAQAAPGAQQTAEHLGLKPGQQLPESARNQQEAARTLLSGIAQSSQAGTTARQQSEEQFLANLKATAAQGGVESGRAIEGQFGKQKADILGKEAAAVTRLQSMGPSLAQKLFSEQSAQRIAAGGLGVKEQQLGVNKFKAVTGAENQRAQRRGEAAKIGQGNVKLQQGQEKLAHEGEKITLAGRKQTADERYKEGKLANEAKRIIEKNNKTAAGPKLTALQTNNYTKEIKDAFVTFQEARAAGVSPQQIRQALLIGQHKNPKTGKNEKNAKVTNPTFIQLAEDVMQKEYVGSVTKAQLRAMKLPDSEWSNLLLGKPSNPAIGRLKGGVRAGVGKKK